MTIAWRRHPSPCRASHQAIVNGVASELWIIAVTHPTALRPYYVTLPGGRILERKFSHLVDAKAAAVEALLELTAEFS